MSISFSSHFKRSEQEAVETLLADFDWPKARATRVRKKASALVEAVRAQKRPMGQLEAFLQDYALDTEEGLALMTLAEALLRVPDKETAKTLIRDKVAAANWLESKGSSKDWVVKAAGVGLFMTSKTLDGVLSRIGEPVVREAMVKAMRILGKQFVLGRDIEEAMQNALPLKKQGYRMSYDILGEGACTAADAQRYYESYEAAIRYIGERASDDDKRQPGISVKLSALHPRYEYAQRDRCVPEMAERVHALATLAAQRNLAFTIDAEESERLNLSIEIIEVVLEKMSFKDWGGFGLAVQAYHKAAPAVIDHMATLADKHNRRIQMRLVKGAYWDSEIKKAQVEGVEDFPVYTRKSHTDMAYMACASRIFSYGDRIYPMFGTHNAHTMAAILDMGKKSKVDFEFQRLFGMGQGLFDVVLEDEGKPASVCLLYTS